MQCAPVTRRGAAAYAAATSRRADVFAATLARMCGLAPLSTNLAGAAAGCGLRIVAPADRIQPGPVIYFISHITVAWPSAATTSTWSSKTRMPVSAAGPRRGHSCLETLPELVGRKPHDPQEHLPECAGVGVTDFPRDAVHRIGRELEPLLRLSDTQALAIFG